MTTECIQNQCPDTELAPSYGVEVEQFHSRLLRMPLATEESRAYWNRPLDIPKDKRAVVAFEERWFGNKSMARVETILKNFAYRFDAYPIALEVLHPLSLRLLRKRQPPTTCQPNHQRRLDRTWQRHCQKHFPRRVDEKCQKDPSLAVAHGCFWKYHPAKAYAWELRLQDEISPDVTIDEENSDPLRQEFEEKCLQLVQQLTEAEEKRRERKRKKTEDDDCETLFDEDQEE